MHRVSRSLRVLLLLVFVFATACGRTSAGDESQLAPDGSADVASESDPSGDTDSIGPLDGVAGDAVVTDTRSDAAVVSLEIDPATATLPVGATLTLVARALLADGSITDVTALATWSSDAPATVKVSSTGLVSAAAAGVSRVRATYGGVSALSIVTVPSAALSVLRVDPGTVETTVGGAATFAATALFSDGTSADVTSSATWSVDAPAIAKVSAAGVATGLAAGSTAVRATLLGKTGSGTLVVSAVKTLNRVEVAPFTSTIGVAVKVSLRATALYVDGTKADVTPTASWTSSAAAVASVDAAGTVTGVGAGTATITAAFGGKSGAGTVVVTTAALNGIAVSPSAATLSVGGRALLTATANYSDGTSVNVTPSALWTSSDAAVAVVSSGTVDGVAAGSATITASFGGKVGTSAITISPAKLLSIAISPAGPVVPLGTTTVLKATGTYEGGTVRDVSNDVTWSTDDALIATVSNAAGSTGRVTPVSVGATTVRATLGGVAGATSLSVTAATATAITVTPNPLSLIAGTKAFLRASATYSDGTSADVSTKCTWSTTSSAVAVVSNGVGSEGQVTARSAGTTTATCSVSGIVGSGTVEVKAPALDTVAISPVAPTCHLGRTLTFVATAISSAGTGSDVTKAAVWSSSTPSVLLYTGKSGEFKCVGKGSATVSATYAGKTGTMPVSVTDAVVVTVQVDPAGVTIPIGATLAYTATAIFSDGSTLDVTNAATWVSSAPAVASISTGGKGGGARGQAAGLKAGSTTITATHAGVAGSTPLTVTSAVVTSITLTPATGAVPVGGVVVFSASAGYSDGTSRNVTSLATWSSSDATIAAVSNAGITKGQATGLAGGTVTIAATYGGVKGTASLTVTTAALSKIEITPATTTVTTGTTVVFKAFAVYADGTKFDITTASVWSSTNTAVATVSNSAGTQGQVTTSSAGTATIRATYKGLTGDGTITAT